MKSVHGRPILWTVAVLLVSSVCCADTNAPVIPPRPSNGTGGEPGIFTNQVIKVNGIERMYRLVVPDKLPEDTPVPLLFGYHAYRGKDKKWLEEYTGLDALAREKGFILAYPLAPINWSFKRVANPDVQLFDAILRDIAKNYNIDLNRVYATGVSNGGVFMNVLAAQRSDVIAAVASHCGSSRGMDPSIRQGKRKCPIMIVHGDADTIIPVEAGRNARDAYKKAGHVVEYIEVKGMGHGWAPGIDQKMWAFFLNHPLAPE